MIETIIYEPMTTITDLMIAIIAFYYSKELYSIYINQLLNVQYHWIWTFRMLALGALLGALSHGIGPYLSVPIANIIWKFTTYSIGIMTYFMFLSLLHHLFEYQFVLQLRWLILFLLIIYLFIVTKNDDFVNVVLFYVPLMAIVLIGLLYSYFVFQSDGVNMIIIGIIISFVGAGVQQSGIELHKHMNHNDISHFIQMLAMWFFYQGSLVFKDSVV